MNNLNLDLKQNIWWIPDDVLVWTLAIQEGPELPNGMANFSLINSIKGIQLVTHPVSSCLKIENYNPNQELHMSPEDLIFLSDVNPGSILNATRIRFSQKLIYTSCGSVLISLNPFGLVPGLYGRESIEKYASSNEISAKPSHLYNIPSRAFDNLVRYGNKNQTIFFSGESGAGKTEATKECLNFLTWASATRFQTSNSSQRDTSEFIDECVSRMHGISEKIIAASPIMEAFGNAQTIRNPNSSRFGKFMEIHFDDNFHISGSTIVPYLLEKSRLTHRNSDERTYHIFYQFLLGTQLQAASLSVNYCTSAASFGLVSDINSYRYLRSGDQYQFAPKFVSNCGKSFQETINAFQNIGFTKEEVTAILKLLAALLYLGNIEFISLEEGESSMVSPSCIHYEKAADLLGITSTSLNYALCTRSIASGLRRNLVTIKLTVEKASDARDCFTRSIYGKLFKAIIASINGYNKVRSTSESDPVGEEMNMEINGSTSDRSIGLLDIFGFEIFAENNFEQLCINYCNEILQNHFNYVIFTAEKQLYILEGINCSTIEFKDNSSLIQEIQSIFKSFDEESRIPKGSSASWFAKKKRDAKSNHITFWSKKRDYFAVRHYAGVVDYIPDVMLEKNTETITNELTYCMQQSSNDMIRNMFTSAALEDFETISNSPRSSPVKSSAGINTNSGGSLTAKSVVWQFQDQLSKLLEIIRESDSHFVRCIKSNDSCKAFLFDNQLVNKQLLYSGIFEVVKIQQSGLPCRVDHSYFMARYRCLVPSKQRWQLKFPIHLINTLKKLRFASPHHPKDTVEALDLPFIISGKTMVFFKGFEQNLLESLRDELLIRSAKILQIAIRCFSRRHLFSQFKLKKGHMESLLLELNAYEATAVFQTILTLRSRLERISRFSVLLHVTEFLRHRLDLVDKQAKLLEELKDLKPFTGQQRTYSRFQILEETLSIAREKLLLSGHPTIAYFEDLNAKFVLAESFLSRMIEAQGVFKSFYVDEMQQGLLQCQAFDDVFETSDIHAATIMLMRSYLVSLQCELDAVVIPLTNALQDEQLIHDKYAGQLVYSKDLKSSKSQLIDVLGIIFSDDNNPSIQSNYDFLNDRTFELCNDCKKFVQLRVMVLGESPSLAYVLEVVSFIKLANFLSPIIQQQVSLFQPWIDVHLFLLEVIQHFPLGLITRSATPLEYNTIRSTATEMMDLEELTGLLSIMTLELEEKYSFELATKIYQITSLIVKLRKLFHDAQLGWQEFATFLSDARREADELRVFNYFSSFSKELDDCDWFLKLHYHMQQIGEILASPLFPCLPLELDGDDWLLAENLLGHHTKTLKCAFDFIHYNDEWHPVESNPLVVDLLSRLNIVQKLIEIRSTIIAHQFDKSFRYISDFKASYRRDSDVDMVYLDAEFDLYLLLMYRIEAENNLDAELEVFSIKSLTVDSEDNENLFSKEAHVDIKIELDSMISLPYVIMSDDYVPVFHTLTTIQDILAESVACIRSAIEKFDLKFPPILTELKNAAINFPSTLKYHVLLTSEITNHQFNERLNVKIAFARHVYLARDILHQIGSENDLGRSKYHDLLKVAIEHIHRFLRNMNLAIYNPQELNDLLKILSFHHNVGVLIGGINLRCLLSNGKLDLIQFKHLEQIMSSEETGLFPLGSFLCNDLVDGLMKMLHRKYVIFKTILSTEELSTIDSSHYIRKSFLPWSGSDILKQISTLKEDPCLVITLFHATFHDLENELNLIYIEYQIRNYVNELVDSLESIRLNSLKDAGFPELVDIISSSLLVDLNHLESLSEKVANYVESGRQFLPDLLACYGSFSSILKVLFLSESSTLGSKDLSEIQSLASTFQYDIGLKTDMVNQIALHVQNLMIVPMIQEALTIGITSKEIKNILMKANDIIATFPNQLQVWLTSAFHYCQLIETLETCDWRQANKIIKSLAEACNDLELKVDEYQRLPVIARASNIKAMNEFIASLKKNITEADRSAYELSKEEQQLFQKLESISIRDLRMTVTLENVQRQIIVRKDQTFKNGLYNSRIPVGGQSDAEIIAAKSFPLRVLWGFEFCPKLLIKHGQYSVADLFNIGYSLQELFTAGVSVGELKTIGATATALNDIRASIAQLRAAKYPEIDILEAGYSIHEIRDASFNLMALVNQGGVTVRRLLDLGFEAVELKKLKFPASLFFDQKSSLNDIGMDPDTTNEMGDYIERVVPSMIEAGYRWNELKEAGLSAVLLHEFGCSFEELRSLGYNDNNLIESGFVEEIEREILVDFYKSTGGDKWRVKMNWCSRKPVRDWYGVITCTFATEEDAEFHLENEEQSLVTTGQRKRKTRFEHVVELALFDNDLSGTIPPRLAGLTQLQALKLQLNPGLHGVIPLTVQAMRNSLDIFDISGNDELFDENKVDTRSEPIIQSYHPQFGQFSKMGDLFGENRNTIDFKEEEKKNTVAAVTMSTRNYSSIVGNSSRLIAKTTSPYLERQKLGKGKSNDKGLSVTTSTRLDALSYNAHVIIAKELRDHIDEQKRSRTAESHVQSLASAMLSSAKLQGTNQPIHNNLDEYTALVALFEATNGHAWHSSANWCSDRPFNEWFGISVNGSGRVTNISLPFNSMEGELPDIFHNFKNLEIIDCCSNVLSGRLPASLFYLERINTINLSNNQFTGILPSDIRQLRSIKRLDLKGNKLAGKIPKALFLMSSLQYLDLSRNSMTCDYSVYQGKAMLPFCRTVVF